MCIIDSHMCLTLMFEACTWDMHLNIICVYIYAVNKFRLTVQIWPMIDFQLSQNNHASNIYYILISANFPAGLYIQSVVEEYA